MWTIPYKCQNTSAWFWVITPSLNKSVKKTLMCFRSEGRGSARVSLSVSSLDGSSSAVKWAVESCSSTVRRFIKRATPCVYPSVTLWVSRLTAVTEPLLATRAHAGKVYSRGSSSTAALPRLTAALSVCRRALENTNGSLMKCSQKVKGRWRRRGGGPTTERERRRGRRNGLKENP